MDKSPKHKKFREFIIIGYQKSKLMTKLIFIQNCWRLEKGGNLKETIIQNEGKKEFHSNNEGRYLKHLKILLGKWATLFLRYNYKNHKRL